MKKIFTTVIFMSLCLILFVGCGSSEEDLVKLQDMDDVKCVEINYGSDMPLGDDIVVGYIKNAELDDYNNDKAKRTVNIYDPTNISKYTMVPCDKINDIQVCTKEELVHIVYRIKFGHSGI
jgi:hypothetical protein